MYSPKPLDVATSNLNRSHDVEGTGQHFVTLIMDFHLNASRPKLLGVPVPNFADA